jgi:hypothetical protein
LKQMGHERLQYFRARRTSDNIRESFNHPNLMKELGFEIWGCRWVKTL